MTHVAHGLVTCDELVGHTTVLRHRPNLTIHENALYVPTGRRKRDEGVFDHGRKLIADAGYFRAHPVPESLYQPVNMLDQEQFAYAPDDVDYVFFGCLTGHFGHFITGSLSRTWALDEFDQRTTRYVLLNHGPLSALFEIGWMRDLLVAFGLRADQFVSFPGPTRFRRIVVPAPAFEEGNFAFQVFGDTCLRAGRRLTAEPRRGGRPVFLTKMHLAGGVYRLENEDLLCRRLERRGIEIVAPERLPLSEQIRLFRDRPALSGMAGSCMHSAIFAPGRRRVELHMERRRLTNQLLLDQLNGGTGVALCPADPIQRPARAGFAAGYRLADPDRIADGIIEAMHI